MEGNINILCGLKTPTKAPLDLPSRFSPSMANMKPFETMAVNMKPFEAMAKMKPSLKNIVPVLVVVVAQILYSIQTTTTKVALRQGMSPYVFTVYRHLVATAIMAPVALIFER